MDPPMQKEKIPPIDATKEKQTLFIVKENYLFTIIIKFYLIENPMLLLLSAPAVSLIYCCKTHAT